MKLLAPMIPFVNRTLIDEKVSYQMRVAQQVASAARAVGDQAGHVCASPLAEVRVEAAYLRRSGKL